ncbi:sodium-coupled neutral amino acid transporter 1 [Scaptodrosophila lebanonensis]|uniref:Sodium-coupled neutral amino acid transporter 1 n=1 Tax=Drosophila lebanonensis TaxID=7225 RepID=A0A6J2T5E6_DROLE|nr:sodium-coupled neutral amino acid transporter 1 [Scaptodrosophila lebanonensis]
MYLFKRQQVRAMPRPSRTAFGMSKRARVQLTPSHQHDQLPFLSRSRFSALPHFRAYDDAPENLSLFIAILYVVDLFGIFPFVTLPGMLVQLGYFGVPLVLSIIFLQIYTSFLLAQCWTMAELLDPAIVQKRNYPYAALAELAYGRVVSVLVSVLLDLSIFAMAVPSVVMAAENLETVVQRMSGGQYTFSYCYWAIIVGAVICPLMWLGSPKHMRGLTIIAACVMIIIVVLLWFCLFSAPPIGKPFEGIGIELPRFLTVLNSYSVLAFQFDIHPMLLTLQIDMKKKSQVAWAALGGIAITCSVAIFGSIVAAYKFGSMIADNLLQSLPSSVPFYIMVILMALQLCFSVTVASSAMFLQIENYFRLPESLTCKRVLIRSTLLALEVLVAEFVPSFDALMDVVGGTITGPLVFILPPLLYRRIRRMERVHQRIAAEASYGSLPLDLNYDPIELEMEPLLAATPAHTPRGCWLRLMRFLYRFECDVSCTMAVLVFGVLATFLATYLNLFTIADMFKNNSPCLGNFTKH